MCYKTEGLIISYFWQAIRFLNISWLGFAERCLSTLNCGRIRFVHKFLWTIRGELRQKNWFHEQRSFMNKPSEAKRSPEVKPWVCRGVEAAGVSVPANADGERRLGWWGVEMARFLKYCKSLPAETGSIA
jgi:hypothetical protein